MDNTSTYLAFVVLGVGLVVLVGQVLIRSGQAYLAEVFPRPQVASSVSKLLAVLFYLFALGLLGIISTMDVPVEGAAQVVVTKLGVVLLVLGIVYAMTMVVLGRVRTRRREEDEEEALIAASISQHHDEDTFVGDTARVDDLRQADDGTVPVEDAGMVTTTTTVTPGTAAAPAPASTSASTAAPATAPATAPTTAPAAAPTTASSTGPTAGPTDARIH